MSTTTVESIPLDELTKLNRNLAAPELDELTREFASRPLLWLPLVRYETAHRWYERLLLTAAVEIWLISWMPGQSTAIHDHGEAAGALTVAEGQLLEEGFEPVALNRTWRLTHATGTSAAFDPSHLHRVSNPGPANAISIHAYSPPGRPVRNYLPAPAEALAR